MFSPYSEASLRGLNFVPFALRLCFNSDYRAQVSFPTGIIPSQSSELLLIDAVSVGSASTFDDSSTGPATIVVVLAGTNLPLPVDTALAEDFLMNTSLLGRVVAALPGSGGFQAGESFTSSPVYAPLLSVTAAAYFSDSIPSNAGILVAGRIFFSVAKASAATQLALVSRAQCGSSLGVVPEECSFS